MPAAGADVNGEKLTALVRRITADVLMVAPDRVKPESALVNDLGAESIDFLDLLFRIEEALGEKLGADRWQKFMAQRLAGKDIGKELTVALVIQFAAETRAAIAGGD